MNDENDLLDAAIIKVGKFLGEYLMLIKKMDRKSVLEFISDIYDLRESLSSTNNNCNSTLETITDDRMVLLLVRSMLSRDLLEMRRHEAALTYVSYLRNNRDMDENAVLDYVIQLLDLHVAVELQREGSDGNDKITKNDKCDYPYPPTEGKSSGSAVKKDISDKDEVLHLCELSSAVNRTRKSNEREQRPVTMEDMKSLDENIHRQIDSLYGRMLDAGSIIELDALSNKIEKIRKKTQESRDILSKYINAAENIQE